MRNWGGALWGRRSSLSGEGIKTVPCFRKVTEEVQRRTQANHSGGQDVPCTSCQKRGRWGMRRAALDRTLREGIRKKRRVCGG